MMIDVGRSITAHAICLTIRTNDAGYIGCLWISYVQTNIIDMSHEVLHIMTHNVYIYIYIHIHFYSSVSI